MTNCGSRPPARSSAARGSVRTLALTITLALSVALPLLPSVGHAPSAPVGGSLAPSEPGGSHPSSRSSSPTSVRVLATYDLVNHTETPGFANGTGGLVPLGVAWAGIGHQFLVSTALPGRITVFAAGSASPIRGAVGWPQGAVIATGPYPDSVYVSNQSSSRSSVGLYNATTLAPLVAPAAIPDNPDSLLLDAADHVLYATEGSLDNVSVLNATTLAVIRTMPTGRFPMGIALDRPDDRLYICDYGASNVTVRNATDGATIASIAVGQHPDGIDYDPTNGEVYVANLFSDNVSVINASRDTVVRTILLPSGPSGYVSGPQSIAWDPVAALHSVVVAVGNNVSIIDDRADGIKAALPAGAGAAEIAFDPSNGSAYVGALDTNNLTFVDVANSTTNAGPALGPEPFAVVPSPFAPGVDAVATAVPPGLVWLNGTSVGGFWGGGRVSTQLSAVAGECSHGANVFEADTSTDSVRVFSTINDSLVADVPVGVDPTALECDRSDGQLWVANAGSDNVSVISLQTDRVDGTISLDGSPSSITADPFVPEEFIAVGPSSFTQPATIAAVNSLSYTWIGNYSLGTFGAVQTLVFCPGVDRLFGTSGGIQGGGIALDPTDGETLGTFGVGAQSTGMACAGTSDLLYVSNRADNNVTVLNAGTLSPVANVTVGAFPDGVAYDGDNNVVLVANEADGTVMQLSVPAGPTYPVDFNESGLPTLTTWKVTLGGLTLSSYNFEVQFYEGSGTYAFTVAPLAGYVVSPQSGNVTVNGPAPGVSITFSNQSNLPKKYMVTFEETGLPAGDRWTVGIRNQNLSGTGSELNVSLPNGSYPFTVGAVGSYVPVPSAATLTVTGQNAIQSVRFSQNPTGGCPGSTCSSNSSGSTTPVTDIVLLGGIVVVLAVVAALVLLRRRRRPRS